MLVGLSSIRIRGLLESEATAVVHAERPDQIALGLAVGVVLAALVEGFTGGELMGGRGVVILPALAVAMTVVGLLAGLGPARRGLRIQPMESLREE